MSVEKILIVSNPQDEHTTRMANKIRELGAKPILFYPERLGRELSLSLSHRLSQEIYLSAQANEAIEEKLSEIYSIWYRRPRLVSFDGEPVSPEGCEFAQDEWRAMLEAVYALTQGLLWVSHPDKLREAARKPLQLLLADQLGLNTPCTLITNEPHKAKDFFELCEGKVVIKATGSGWIYSRNKEDVNYVLTNRISRDDLAAVDEIKLAPVTFQEEIPKAYEIRANIVGQEVLAIKIDSQCSEISKLDWRRYDVNNTPYLPYRLPRDVEAKCLKLAQLLGLEFGAVDLIRKPNGEYIFLEINGNGQFLWAEELSGVKISEALARLLTGITPPLKSMCLP